MCKHLSFKTLASIVLGVLLSAGQATSQAPALGKNFDEVVKLAAKEGKVRVGSGCPSQMFTEESDGFPPACPE